MKRTVILIVIPTVALMAAKKLRGPQALDRFVHGLEDYLFAKQVNHSERSERRAEKREMGRAGQVLSGHNVTTSYDGRGLTGHNVGTGDDSSESLNYHQAIMG